MASPHLAPPSASSVGQTSASTSPAHSNATAATFGPGSRGPSNNTNARRTNNPRSPNATHSNPPARQHHVIEGPGGRILCVADVRGNLSSLNKLAAETNAQAIIHSGDFGFYESESFERISDRTLRHLVQYSTLIPQQLRTKLLTADLPGGGRPAVNSAGGNATAALPPPTTPCKEMRNQMLSHPDSPLLSEFPALKSGKIRLNVPVYTVWGACEDVRILEKIRTKEYVIDNLHVLDEASTYAVEVGGVRLRLFGLGGAVVLHKLFDNGEGAATIAGGQGTMWTTILQIGELVDTAQKCYDPSETRLLITHASPGREGLLMQLALAVKADLTISAGLHFRYGVSYNEFSVQSDPEQFRRKLLQSKSAFGEVWDSVREQVEKVVDDQQRVLLNNGLAVTNRAPAQSAGTGGPFAEEPAWKNTWNWNLPDAAFGHLVLDIIEGRVSSEMRSQGFNFAYRRTDAASAQTPSSNTIVSPVHSAATPATATNINPAVAKSQQTPNIPTGPAKLRQQENHAPAPTNAPPRGSGPLLPKSPRQHRSPNVSQSGVNSDKEGATSQSRPTSSRGHKHGHGHRSSGEEGFSRGPRAAANGENGQSHGAKKETVVKPANDAITANIDAVPAGGKGEPVSDPKSKRGHRNKKSGGAGSTGWSSGKSEKSASDSEAKHAEKESAAVRSNVGEGANYNAAATGESANSGNPGVSGAPRGGGRGRGGPRGGRGGRGGGSGRGGLSQERRKSATSGGGGEQKASAPTGGTNAKSD